VTECLGGSMELGEEELGLRYQVGFFSFLFLLVLWVFWGLGWVWVTCGECELIIFGFSRFVIRG